METEKGSTQLLAATDQACVAALLLVAVVACLSARSFSETRRRNSQRAHSFWGGRTRGKTAGVEISQSDSWTPFLRSAEFSGGSQDFASAGSNKNRRGRQDCASKNENRKNDCMFKCTAALSLERHLDHVLLTSPKQVVA